MTIEREPRAEPATAAADSQLPGLAPGEPLNEAQRWWDAQMAEARRWYPKVLESMHPRPMSPEQARRWLAERDKELRQEQWKPWSPDVMNSDPI